MASQIRVSEQTYATLYQISKTSEVSMQSVLDDAVEAYRRSLILHAANESYARLRTEPNEWQEELRERNAWEATLKDGLED